MTPLEAVQQLATGPCPTFWDVELVGTVSRFGPDQGSVLKCAHCRQKLHAHAPDCPWLQMSRIVTALEAAERVVYRAYRPDTDHPGQRGYVTELRALAAALKDTP